MATVPSEMTAVAGAVLTAAQWNSNVRDAINFMINRPTFEGRQTVTQNVTTSTDTGLTFDVEDVDNDGGHSTVTNTSRYTAQTAGRFQVSGGVGWNGNTAGRRSAALSVNGTRVNASEVAFIATSGFSVYTPTRTRSVFLNAGDYVEVLAWQDSGSTITTWVTTSGQPSMSVRWVGTT